MGAEQTVGGEADRLAGNVMKEIDDDARTILEAERKREARVRAAGPRKKAGLALLSILFVALTALNLSGIGPFGYGTKPPTGADLRLAMSGEVDDLVDQLELYREEFGTYPGSVAEIGADEAVWEYERLSPDRCRVALTEGREVVTAELTEAGR